MASDAVEVARRRSPTSLRAGVGVAGEHAALGGCRAGCSTLSTPPTIRPKNGSLKKRLMNGSSARRVSASERTSATAPVRRVTNVRAAWFGT